MSRRITSWHVSRLRAAHRRSGSIVQAAAAAGVSIPTAYRVLAEFVKTVGFTTHVVRQAIDLYKSGQSCRGVARIIREQMTPAPSQETICQWVRAAGVIRSRARADEVMNARLNGRDYDVLRKKARFLAAEQMLSITRIAKTLGVSRNFVKRAVPPHLHCDPSLATERRKWQAFLPDVERRRQLRDEVCLRRERGQKLDDIVAATGLSKSTVWLYCRKGGLTKPIAGRIEP